MANIDSTLVEVHSANKAGVVPYFKNGCGFRPVVCSTADGEPPSGMLRASEAAAGSIADHICVLDSAMGMLREPNAADCRPGDAKGLVRRPMPVGIDVASSLMRIAEACKLACQREERHRPQPQSPMILAEGDLPGDRSNDGQKITPSEMIPTSVVDELSLADSVGPPAAKLRTLSTWIIVLFVIHAILRLSFFTAYLNRAQWLRDYRNGLNPDVATLDHAERLLADWTPLSLILLPGAVLLAVWSRRATMNLRAWGETTKWGTAWSAWGWFVPIMWFFVPYPVVRAAFRQCPRDLPQKWGQKALSVLWAVCIFGFWTTQAALRLAERWWPSPDVPEWTLSQIESAVRSDALSAFGELLFCIVSVLTFVVIRAVSNAHESKLRERSWRIAALGRRPSLPRLLKLIAFGYLGLVLCGSLVMILVTAFSGFRGTTSEGTAAATVTRSAADIPTATSVGTSHATAWSVRDCVAIPPRADKVRQVPCSSSMAGGTVVAIETDIDQCALPADLWVGIERGRFACIDDWNYEVADFWQVGACVAFDGDVVEPVDCDSDEVNGRVVANTSDPDRCPAHAETYVTYDTHKVACLSYIEATAEPVATTVPPVTTESAAIHDDPQQHEFNEADEREYLRTLDRGEWASLRYRMLALVGEDVIDNWTLEEFMEALTARQPETREMVLQLALDEQLVQELLKAARLSMQAGDTSGSFAPSQLGKPTGADAHAVSSLIEMLEERAEAPQRSGPQIDLLDPAWLRSVLNQQFQVRVGRKASATEQQAFVNEIHAEQRAGVAGTSLDLVARAGEFAEQADPFGAAAMKRLNAGRTIREALQEAGW